MRTGRTDQSVKRSQSSCLCQIQLTFRVAGRCQTASRFAASHAGPIDSRRSSIVRSSEFGELLTLSLLRQRRRPQRRCFSCCSPQSTSRRFKSRERRRTINSTTLLVRVSLLPSRVMSLSRRSMAADDRPTVVVRDAPCQLPLSGSQACSRVSSADSRPMSAVPAVWSAPRRTARISR